MATRSFRPIRAGEHTELLSRLRQDEEALRALIDAVEDAFWPAPEEGSRVAVALKQAHEALGDILP